MISHANRQLRKMNDRYILLRDPKEPLALQVIDNYQAGEIRSTRNLSGGESFLVSLALSLGLSAMASHNVRVDSLFLDEGFGTLDEEALDTALQTLAELQQDGKLIGIISHVRCSKNASIFASRSCRDRAATAGCSGRVAVTLPERVRQGLNAPVRSPVTARTLFPQTLAKSQGVIEAEFRLQRGQACIRKGFSRWHCSSI